MDEEVVWWNEKGSKKWFGGTMPSHGPWRLFSPMRVRYFVRDESALRQLAEDADVRFDQLEQLAGRLENQEARGCAWPRV